jgi:hypothetical protein
LHRWRASRVPRSGPELYRSLLFQHFALQALCAADAAAQHSAVLCISLWKSCSCEP